MADAPHLVFKISTVADGSMLNRDDYTDFAIVKARRLFLEPLGISIDQTTRVNVTYDEGRDYITYRAVKESDKGAGMHDDKLELADALVTKTPGHALFLPLADCVGALLYDPTKHVIMLSHLGRHSLIAQGGIASVKFLVKHYKVNPENLVVWLTPAPSKASYPIWDLGGQGMKEAAFAQLISAGILPHNIIDNPTLTDQDPNYFSHSEFLAGRRESDGRYAIVAMLSTEPDKIADQ